MQMNNQMNMGQQQKQKRGRDPFANFGQMGFDDDDDFFGGGFGGGGFGSSMMMSSNNMGGGGFSSFQSSSFSGMGDGMGMGESIS